MIIIKGEMPKGCEVNDENHKMKSCPLKNSCEAYLKRYQVDRDLIDYYPEDCPIVGEIPDEHGDLKDIADIMQRYEHEIVKLKAELTKEQYEQIFRIFHVFIKPWIDQAPTILESTK